MLDVLGNLVVETDCETGRCAWSTTVRLADRHGLTLSDASDLDLAQRFSLPLATLDKDLRSAAQAAGLDLAGL